MGMIMKLVGWLFGMSVALFCVGCATEGTVSTGVYYYEPVYIGPPAIWYAPYYPYYPHYYRHHPPVYHRHEVVKPAPPQRPPQGTPPPQRIQPPTPRPTAPPPANRPAPTPRGPQRTK